MTVLAWSPLKNGLLTGKYAQARGRAVARLASALFESRLQAIGGQPKDPAGDTIHAVVSIAGEVGAESAQVALTWLLQRPQPVIPIMGARTLDQFRQNLAAVEVTLTASQLSRLDEVSRVSLGYLHDYLNGDLSRGFRAGGLYDRIIP
jgi:aryl-alcohol dehydrogenase-like predicted oxidoreductase